MRSFLETLVDQQITAIEQASDYVQFHLGRGAVLTVFNPIRATSPLAQLVGHTIEQVDIGPDEVVFVVTSANSFSVLVAEEDYRGPEAMSYVGPGGERAVWN